MTEETQLMIRRALVQAGLALMIGLLALDLVKLLIELYEVDKTGSTLNLNHKAEIPVPEFSGRKDQVIAHE